MKINKEGLKIIKDSESLKLKSYICPAGILTVAYGHTGADVAPNMTISVGRAEELLKSDLRRFELGVEKLLEVKTSPNEFSAMVSLAFNIGLGNFKNSEVLINHNKDHKYEACIKFHNWRRGGGRILKGLVRRRIKEAELYIS